MQPDGLQKCLRDAQEGAFCRPGISAAGWGTARAMQTCTPHLLVQTPSLARQWSPPVACHAQAAVLRDDPSLEVRQMCRLQLHAKP